MEPVHSIPLASPPSPLSVLLVNFFDPRHTLDSLAKSLGLTIEGLLDYIALPHVAAALDHAEALIYRRAAHRATAAIEQVLSELQSLPSLPAAPTPADTDRHRKHLEATRRAADLLRKSLPSPRAPQSAPLRQHPRVVAPPHSAPIPRHDPRSSSERDSRRVQPRLEADDTLIEHPAIPLRASTPAATLDLAQRAGTASADAPPPGPPLTPEQARAIERLVVRDPTIYQRAPALFGTPYSRGQAG